MALVKLRAHQCHLYYKLWHFLFSTSDTMHLDFFWKRKRDRGLEIIPGGNWSMKHGKASTLSSINWGINLSTFNFWSSVSFSMRWSGIHWWGTESCSASQKSKTIIPPTQDVLLQHSKRVAYTRLESGQPCGELAQQETLTPEGHGWTLHQGSKSWAPVWTTIVLNRSQVWLQKCEWLWCKVFMQKGKVAELCSCKCDPHLSHPNVSFLQKNYSWSQKMRMLHYQ
jgi:hypothetical protein